MPKRTITGLETLTKGKKWQKLAQGKIGLLCHNASINHQFEMAPTLLQNLFKKRLKVLFGPQHGLFTDLQDNMVETKNFIHPHFKMKVYSLYSETRIPTKEMLNEIDTLIIDLQDVGTRIYTYISTVALIMKAVHENFKNKIRIIILDRPNPASANIIEGNILDPNFKSFVGIHPLPTRHGMTMGEIAKLFQYEMDLEGLDLHIIPMKNYQRNFLFEETGLPWVLPSPNLSHPISAVTFPATVAVEGTNLSEGRGTTRPLELIGHPNLEPYSFLKKIEKRIKNFDLDLNSFALRPITVFPMFQKHANTPCGGIYIHPLKPKKLSSWRLGQFLMRELYHHLGDHFKWKQPPYEYVDDLLPIDVINGTDKLRHWIEKNGTIKELKSIEEEGLKEFKNIRKEFLLY